jgi:AcrR family transcriptional regulator
VATVSGDSVAGRRGLPRGPQALPRQQVAAHQRERLFDAMVEVVNERGFVSTTISDLVTRAGISRRSFYEHFANKDECLLATYDTIVEGLNERLAASYDREDEWLDRLQAVITTLFEEISARPDAARLICVEIGASGPAGMQRWAAGTTELERFISSGFAHEPGTGTLPDPVARAIVGALRMIVYSRVRRERSGKALKADLMKLVPELMRWISTYYPSPAGLPASPRSRRGRALSGGRAPGSLVPPSPTGARGLPRGEHNLPRGFVWFNQHERIFDAIANLTAAKGYPSLGLEDIAAEAAVSLQTFYTHFENKEEAFLATYEVGHERAMAAVNRSLTSQKNLIDGVRAGVLALLEFLAAEPAYAHLACVDILIAYPHVAGRVEEANLGYTDLLDLGLSPEQPRGRTSIVREAVMGGVFELLHDYILRGRAQRLPELADHVSYIALTPFIGAEQAAKALAGDR